MSDHHEERQHLYSIGVVCRRTGLKSDRLRAWELRYDAVEPLRSAGNQRLYRESDVRRLLLLRQATDAGHRIGQIAHLTPQELDALVALDAVAPHLPAPLFNDEVVNTGSVLGACLVAVQRLDGRALRRELDAALQTLGSTAITQRLLVPLVQDIGSSWAEGRLQMSHEHLATAVLRSFIEDERLRNSPRQGAPQLLVTTLAGERHELGALLAAASAGDNGWNVTYLGPDLPADDIAAAARQRGVNAIGLSVVCPGEEAPIDDELRKLRRHVGDDTGIILGGAAAARFEGVAADIGAVLVDDLVGLHPALALFA